MKPTELAEIDTFKRRGIAEEKVKGIRPPKGARKYAILRVGKIKSTGALVSAARHNLREMNVPNADADQVSANVLLVGSDQARDVAAAWKDRAPDKVRKNAVHALEYVITASPEAMTEMGAENADTYLRDALAWLQERHGAENILSAVIHNDETTPHLQALVIPMDDRDRLNARAFVNGRATLATMQTDFAEAVGHAHGLDRGEERSRATHKNIGEYYGQITATQSLNVVLPERLTGGILGRGGETDAEWHERASKAATEALRGATGALVDQIEDLRRESAQSRLQAFEAKLGIAAMAALDDIANMDDPDGQIALLREFEDQIMNSGVTLPDGVRERLEDWTDSIKEPLADRIAALQDAADELLGPVTGSAEITDDDYGL
mgnify:CR=1 FL=1|jgi:hypothetical protein